MAKKRKLVKAPEREEVAAAELDPPSSQDPTPADADVASTDEDTTPVPNPGPIAEDASAGQQPSGAEPPAVSAPNSGGEYESSGAEAPAVSAPNSGGDERDAESIQKLLEPLTKDLLVELLRDAAASHADVLARVHAAADADPVHRKIFVHGLGWEATTDALRAAFLPYGEIDDCKVVSDKLSGRSRGYGFVLFKDRSGVRNALKEPQKKIGNRTACCQLASIGAPPPSAPPPQPESEYTQRKIYISNVGPELDPQKLTEFFTKYGEIEDGPLGLDKLTGKPKGFCLFVYKTIESARNALEEPHKSFQGHVLHCQKAIDGPKAPKLGFGFPLPAAPNIIRGDSAAYSGNAGNLLPGTTTLAGFNQATGALFGPYGGGLAMPDLLNAVRGVSQVAQNPGAAGIYGNQMGGAMHSSYGNGPQGSAGRGHLGMGQYMRR